MFGVSKIQQFPLSEKLSKSIIGLIEIITECSLNQLSQFQASPKSYYDLLDGLLVIPNCHSLNERFAWAHHWNKAAASTAIQFPNLNGILIHELLGNDRL